MTGGVAPAAGAARAVRRLLARALTLAGVAATGGCAYFNGIYNAHQAEKKADGLARRGLEGDAAGQYQISAVKAETVLVRHGKSHWATEALYLAGRGWALSGQCDHGRPRLEALLEHRDVPPPRRERAQLALGMCDVRQLHYDDARARLTPLVASPDKDVSTGAALWAARAAIAVGDNDAARDFLRSASPGAADWELARGYLGQRRYADAESLLVLRARKGDFRPEALDDLRELWAAGDRDGVERLVRAYDAARMRNNQRAVLHLMVGDLMVDASSDSAARAHFLLSQRLGRDSVPGREATTRLTLLALRDAATLTDVENLINRGHDPNGVTTLQQRLEDNLIFLKILENRTDYTGSSLFLAGEVARDSLRAYSYAHAIFKRVVTGLPSAPVAPKALLAAAALRPDSADAYQARLRADYPTSPYTLAIDNRDNPLIATANSADALLQQAWANAVREFTDQMNQRKAAQAAKTGATATAATTSTTPPPTTTPP